MMKWLYVALASSVAGLDYESLEASQDLVSRGVSWLVRYDTTAVSVTGVAYARSFAATISAGWESTAPI